MGARPAPAGTREALVTLQQVAETPAPSGMPVKTPTGVEYSLWASRNDLTSSGWSRERVVSDQVSARLETEWRLPYRPEIDPSLVDVPSTFQMLYLGRAHDIVIASVIGRNDGVLLTTTVRVG